MWAAAKGARQKRAANGETKGQNNKARHSQKRQEKAKKQCGAAHLSEAINNKAQPKAQNPRQSPKPRIRPQISTAP